MILRPADPSGDILPVRASADLVSGPEAVALLVRYRLTLLRGEWWENPALGFGLPETMRASRLSAAEAPALSTYVTEYIRETPGVQAVEDVASSVSGRQFAYSCTVRTKEGSATVSYETDL